MTFGFISDETLLGYLLGALDDHEQVHVRDALLQDKHLRARLNALQAITLPVKDESELIEPPGSMVARVMSGVQQCIVGDGAEMASHSTCAGRESDAVPLLPEASNAESPSFKRAWLDVGMSLTAAVIGVCVFPPAILQSRETARSSHCAANLMMLGQQIRDYAFQNRRGLVPEVSTQGPLAFAGVYAIHLNDSGRLNEKEVLWCPSAGDDRLSVVGVAARQLPSLAELQSYTPARRRVWQHIAGGSYAYNLGVMIDNKHTMPTLDDDADLAILADAPIQSENAKLVFTTHRGSASNVLYRDGRVRLLRLDRRYDGPDHPYLNRKGVSEAGIERDDSALGASHLPPLGPAR